jgi:hypothetical protein
MLIPTEGETPTTEPTRTKSQDVNVFSKSKGKITVESSFEVKVPKGVLIVKEPSCDTNVIVP